MDVLLKCDETLRRNNNKICLGMDEQDYKVKDQLLQGGTVDFITVYTANVVIGRHSQTFSRRSLDVTEGGMFGAHIDDRTHYSVVIKSSEVGLLTITLRE